MPFMVQNRATGLFGCGDWDNHGFGPAGEAKLFYSLRAAKAWVTRNTQTPEQKAAHQARGWEDSFLADEVQIVEVDFYVVRVMEGAR